jgi:hypothetical protein
LEYIQSIEYHKREFLLSISTCLGFSDDHGPLSSVLILLSK